MNPFLLEGPAFLLFFALAQATLLLLALVSDPLLRRPKRLPSRAEVEALEAYELAYLVGGHRMAVEAAIVSLVHTGRLAFDEEGRLARGAALRARVNVHAYRSVRFDEHWLDGACTRLHLVRQQRAFC